MLPVWVYSKFHNCTAVVETVNSLYKQDYAGLSARRVKEPEQSQPAELRTRETGEIRLN